MFVAFSVIVLMATGVPSESVPTPMPAVSDSVQLNMPQPLPVITPDPPPAPLGPTMTVSAGDTLSGIAQAWGADLAAIVAANGIANPDIIQVDQQLVLPGGHRPAVAPPVSYGTAPGTASPPSGVRPVVASTGNHFSFGYCTWYVANRRPVPWFGDAGQWGPNARAMGFPEGAAPRAGAIMVTWEGPIGHVAFVEAVNADGSWVVSEMNYKGWNIVDTRTVRPGTVPLEVFIY